MKVVQINCTYNVGSTGKITKDLHEFLLSKGVDSFVLYSDGKTSDSGTKKYMNKFERIMFSIHSHLLGKYGFEGKVATKRIIRFLKKEKPDIVQLHNLHSHNCDLKTLFSYLSQTNIQVCYSLHDCWAFTGYCPHFSFINCYKWKSECKKCPVWKQFSFFFDKSNFNFHSKKIIFSSFERIHFIFASQWIKQMASNSFLEKKDMQIIHCGIDQNIFRPVQNIHFKEVFKEESINVVGVAFNFTAEKGIMDFLNLASMIDKSINIILVGNVDNNIKIPSNVTCIERQTNQIKLAEIFSAADIFVNLTKEETFGLTNVEALSCGTPVITYNSGGSPEAIDNTCGAVVECGDFDGLIKSIYKYGKKKADVSLRCIERSLLFSKNKMCEKYFELYRNIKNN